MYNRAILIGRLTADPEMRTTPNGVNVASFRIAVDRPFTAKGAEKKTDFISITCWRQQAEFVCRYFSKGRAIGVEGSIQTRDYTDRDGNKRNTFEIVADRVFFVESKSAASASPAAAPAAPRDNGVSYASGSAGDFQVISDDDDLPF
jgi:single-strand DNA-binding protein